LKNFSSLLSKYLAYILIFSVSLTHPFVRVVVKLLFLLNFFELKKLSKIDVVVLTMPIYQLFQSLFYGNFLLFVSIPQGITPVFSYSVRFAKIKLETALKILLFGILILAISIILQGLFGVYNYKNLFFLLKKTQLSIHIVRPWHTFLGHILTAGAFLSVGFFLSILLFIKENKKSYYVAMLLTSAALMFTFDRSYWISTSVTFVFISVLLGFLKRKKEFLIAPILILVLFTIPLITVSPFKERLVSVVDVHSNQSNKYRIAIWKGGIDYFLNAPVREKLLGVSRFCYKEKLKNFIEKEERELGLQKHIFSHLHSDYITVLIWYGVIGLILFVITFGYLIFKNFELFLIYKDYTFIFFICSYITILVSGAFEYNFEDESVKYLIYILFGLNAKFILNKELS